MTETRTAETTDFIRNQNHSEAAVKERKIKACMYICVSAPFFFMKGFLRFHQLAHVYLIRRHCWRWNCYFKMTLMENNVAAQLFKLI